MYRVIQDITISFIATGRLEKTTECSKNMGLRRAMDPYFDTFTARPCTT